MTWQVVRADYRSGDLAALLTQEWEPFAVSCHEDFEDGIFLRKATDAMDAAETHATRLTATDQT